MPPSPVEIPLMGVVHAFEDRLFIVLATFDAGDRLDAQIESIRAQTHEQWQLIARDDGSSDDTRDRLARWAARDARITILSDELGHLDAGTNFSVLLDRAVEEGAEWIALSDQDDVWLPHKLDVQLERARQVGATRTGPILIHSDLEVVGEHLEPMHPSLLSFQGIRHEPDAPLQTLLIQNFVTGCSVLVNRALLEVALPIPAGAIMHDWWLALCAAACGRIEFVPDVTVRYRQHASSQIGAKHYGDSIRKLLGRTLRLRRHPFDELIETIEQARALESRLAACTCASADRPAIERAHELVRGYLALYQPGVSRMSRMLGVQRLGVARQDRIRDVAFKLKLLTTAIQLPPPSHEGPAAQPSARMR